MTTFHSFINICDDSILFNSIVFVSYCISVSTQNVFHWSHQFTLEVPNIIIIPCSVEPFFVATCQYYQTISHRYFRYIIRHLIGGIVSNFPSMIPLQDAIIITTIFHISYFARSCSAVALWFVLMLLLLYIAVVVCVVHSILVIVVVVVQSMLYICVVLFSCKE